VTHHRTLGEDFDWRAPRLSWPLTSDVGPGLSGVIASGTRVSWLDPARGRLRYRGLPLDQLAGQLDFEQVAYLLITGRDPRRDTGPAQELRRQLRVGRRLPPQVVALVRALPAQAHPTRMLRAGVSALGCHELGAGDPLSGEQHWRELRIVGQVAALAAEVARHRRGLPAEPCDEQGGLADCVLRALGDRPADELQVRALNLLWVLYADHGLDAPSFTSMVVASCQADPYYNVVAGLSALRGPLQGGASERVLELLLGLHSPQQARARIDRMLAGGERIPGFGHRAYRRPDPRAAILRRESREMARRCGRQALWEVARAAEQQAAAALAPRGVFVNINFYAALLFHLLGADGPLIPCLYAVGRMAGLVARVHEALEGGRLFRPLARYVGPAQRPLPGAGR
jgi:citrate synthase